MKVIVTGASKGIGRGIATVLAAHGHSVGMLARSDDLLKQIKDQFEARRTNDEAIYAYAPCDITNNEATDRAIEKLIDQMGGVDALINNAGLIIHEDTLNISLEDWHRMFDVNVHGMLYATRAVLPHMKEQDSGHIINISSISGRLPLPGSSGYAATKYAVSGFSESLFQEVRDFGIKVTLVFPGSIDSASHRSEGEDAAWKVPPEQVGEACHNMLMTPPGTVISRLEIRPLGRPPKK